MQNINYCRYAIGYLRIVLFIYGYLGRISYSKGKFDKILKIKVILKILNKQIQKVLIFIKTRIHVLI